MFGEFLDDDVKDSAMAESHEESRPAGDEASSEPLWMRIALHLASQPDVVLQSQQRGEPELTVQEKVDVAVEVMNKSPSQFLYRFSRYLKLEHLQHFEEQAASDPVIEHYLQQARDKLDKKKANVLVRNRRWAAIQQLERAAANSSDNSNINCSNSQKSSIATDHKDYFTESEMRKRNPLLYHQLVGQHLTDQEKLKQKHDFDKADCRFTTIIFDHMDQCDERELKKKQEDLEDDMFEEEEEEEEDDEREEDMEEEQSPADMDRSQKALLKEEFVSSMYSAFVTGKDDTFDYKRIDENEDYDLLDIEGHDKEERYFDEESPCEVMSDHSNSSRCSPIMPLMCLDRRIKQNIPDTGAHMQHYRPLPTQHSTQNNAEQNAQHNAEQKAQNNTEQNAQHNAEQKAPNNAEQNAQQTTQHNGQDTTEQTTQHTIEALHDEVPDTHQSTQCNEEHRREEHSTQHDQDTMPSVESLSIM